MHKFNCPVQAGSQPNQETLQKKMKTYSHLVIFLEFELRTFQHSLANINVMVDNGGNSFFMLLPGQVRQL